MSFSGFQTPHAVNVIVLCYVLLWFSPAVFLSSFDLLVLVTIMICNTWRLCSQRGMHRFPISTRATELAPHPHPHSHPHSTWELNMLQIFHTTQTDEPHTHTEKKTYLKVSKENNRWRCPWWIQTHCPVVSICCSQTKRKSRRKSSQSVLYISLSLSPVSPSLSLCLPVPRKLCDHWP